MPLELRAVAADDPAARRLQQVHSDDTDGRYGPIALPPLDPATFVPPHGRFVLACDGDEVLGCGGFRPLGDGRAELKCLHVLAAARRRGVAKAVLAHLEDEARSAGYRELWLETGTEQPEAMRLYEASGYRPVEPYGHYRGDARVRCYARALVDAV